MRKALATLLAVTLGVVLALVGTVALAARDSGGTYSRPSGNPVTTGTPISSTWANALTADIATEITDSFSRSGKGAMLSALKLYSGGSAAVPELSWSDDTDTGLYSIGANNVGLSIGGTKRWDFAAAGSTLTGTLTVSGETTLQSTLSVTSTITSGAITAPSLTSAAASDVTVAAPSGQSAHLSANGGTVGFSVLTGGTNDNKSRRLVNVADPSGAQDSATKNYVDGVWHRVALSSEQSTTSSTLSGVTGVSFSVSANGEYEWDIFIPCRRANAAATNLKLAISGPTGASLVRILLLGNDGNANAYNEIISGFGSAATVSSGGSGPLGCVYITRGHFLNGANAGTVQLQFASSDNTTAVYVEQGASLGWRRIDTFE